jgi:hypothetical protein
MDLVEIAALVGAAAWLPQIGQWIYRLVTRSKVVLVPVRNFEVGFSPFGPMLNLRAAIGAERKDATITLATASLRHERGRAINLHWTSFTETFSQMRDKSGETTEIEREQVATALRISTAILTEKFIRFQDVEFQNEALKQLNDSNALKDRLSSAEGFGSTMIASKEFTSLIGHYRHGFCWEAGMYELVINLHLLGVSKPAVARMTFALDPRMVDRLRENLELVERGFRSQLADEEVPTGVQYYWATPLLDTSRVLKSAYLPTR